MQNPSKNTVTLFMPVRNEIEGLKLIWPKIPKSLFNQILLVDKSDDNQTIEWAKENNIECIPQKGRGLRNAYIQGWPSIRSEYVITFSPDGNCLTEDLPALVAELQNDYDMVIASRYAPGSRSDDDDAITAFGNWMFTFLINICFRGQYTDVMTIYRGYRTRLFKELDLHLDKSYWQEKLFFTIVGIEPLLSIRAAKRKLRISSIPSIEPARIAGTRKLQIFRWGASHLVQVGYELIFWK